VLGAPLTLPCPLTLADRLANAGIEEALADLADVPGRAA
jgi:hypothetical protein